MKTHSSIRSIVIVLRCLWLVIAMVMPHLLFGQEGPVTRLKAKAEANDAYSQALYGYWLLNNNDGAYDTVEAVRWISRSAEAEHPCGEHLLAVLHRGGIGVAVDKERAATLDRIALPGLKEIAEGGNSWVELLLGDMYRNGDGVPVNIDSAIRWLTMAAEHDLPSAQFRLARLLHAQKADKVTVVYWLHRAAEKGHPEAQYYYGLACFLGKGTPIDTTEGVKWLRSSANQGYAPATEMLATLANKGAEPNIAP